MLLDIAWAWVNRFLPATTPMEPNPTIPNTSGARMGARIIQIIAAATPAIIAPVTPAIIAAATRGLSYVDQRD